MNECDQLPVPIQRICRGEDPNIPLADVNLNRANGFGGIILPLPPLDALSPSNPQSAIHSPHSERPPSVPSSELRDPSLIVRGWNFTAAMARWALAGMPRRSQEEIDARLAICQACPALQNDHCTKCGCACVEQNRLINKLALATEKCPEGKWD